MASTTAAAPLNRKKIQRTTKQSKLKEFPLLNLYILVVGVLEILGEIFGVFILKLLKPLPILLMIIYISGKNSQRDHLVPTIIRAGLILSLVGDVFLMVNQMSAFMIGTVFFLFAHILYVVAFTIGTKVRVCTPTNLIVRLGIGFIYVAMCISNIYTLWDVFPNRFLFTTYGIVLCFMNLFALKRYQITTPYSFGFVVAGAILFGLSDNLLAMLKFNKYSTNLGRAVVMLFYYSGQYLLMHGAMHHSNLQHEINKYFKNSGSMSASPTLSVGKASPKHSSRQWDHGEGKGEDISINPNDKQRFQ